MSKLGFTLSEWRRHRIRSMNVSLWTHQIFIKQHRCARQKRQRLMSVCEKKKKLDERAVKKVGCKSGWSISQPRPLITSLFWCSVVQCIRMICCSSVTGAHLRTTLIAIKIARKAFETTFERFSELVKGNDEKWRGIPRINKIAIGLASSRCLIKKERMHYRKCSQLIFSKLRSNKMLNGQ